MRASIAAVAIVVAIISVELLGGARPALAQTRTPQGRRPARESVVREVRVDETPARATGLPLPDLIVKDACMDNYNQNHAVRFLVANVGNQDAQPFEVGVGFAYPDGAGWWQIKTLGADDTHREGSALKAGEEKWVEYYTAMTWTRVYDPNEASRFNVYVDPSYERCVLGPGDNEPGFGMGCTGHYETAKSKIAESNKKNNIAAFVKTEMKSCGIMAPVNRPNIPQLPVTKRPPIKP